MPKLKSLGLIFIAVLVLSATAAATASADEFTAEAYPTTLTGSIDPGFTDEFIATAGVVKCKAAAYKGTIAAASTSLSVTPDYDFAPGGGANCTTAGVPSIISPNGCTYKLNVGGSSSTTGDADLVCPAGQEFTVTVSPASLTHPCTYHIKAQSDITGTVTYTNFNFGSTREITVNAELSGIDYTHTAGTGLAKCPAGSATNGTLKAKAVITGEVDPSGVHRGVFMSTI